MKPRQRIKTTYPVTMSDIDMCGGQRLREMILRISPPDYQSRGGRCKRWRSMPDLLLWGICGHAAQCRIVPVDGRTRKLPRAWGSYAAMRELMRLALAHWHDLPHGKEIETLFDRAFPPVLTLEPTPLEDKTK